MAQHEDFMSIYRQAIQGLEGGGRALESQLVDIEEGKRQAIAGGQQALVSSGLAGTTMMASVPLQAEKGAGRARLAARGQTERLQFQTLASYAALGQQSKEARLEREASMERLMASITGQQDIAAIGAQPGILAALRQDPSTLASGGGPGPFGGGGGGGVSGGGGGGYASRFPSIYDQGGGIGAAPSLTGGGGGAWEVLGDQYQLTYGGGRKETISGEQYSAMGQAGQLPGGGGGVTSGGGMFRGGMYGLEDVPEAIPGGGGAVEGGAGWQTPKSMSAGPGFTYTWIGGPEGHYTIGSTPGSTGEDVGMDAIRAASTGDLGAVSDPTSPVSRYISGGYGGGF